jgi:hypothetical protein
MGLTDSQNFIGDCGGSFPKILFADKATLDITEIILFFIVVTGDNPLDAGISGLGIESQKKPLLQDFFVN